MKAKFITTTLAVVLLAVLIAGCSSKPSEELIQKEYARYIEELLGGAFKAENITKVNGVAKDQIHYTAYVEYDLVLLVDRQKIIKVAEGKLNNSNGQVKIPTTWTGMSALTTVPSDARPGYRERRTDEISFVKADQGWMVDDSE